jgi:hypothetical protein
MLLAKARIVSMNQLADEYQFVREEDQPLGNRDYI